VKKRLSEQGREDEHRKTEQGGYAEDINFYRFDTHGAHNTSALLRGKVSIFHMLITRRHTVTQSTLQQIFPAMRSFM
jgi:hypothetical protein